MGKKNEELRFRDRTIYFRPEETEDHYITKLTADDVYVPPLERDESLPSPDLPSDGAQ